MPNCIKAIEVQKLMHDFYFCPTAKTVSPFASRWYMFVHVYFDPSRYSRSEDHTAVEVHVKTFGSSFVYFVWCVVVDASLRFILIRLPWRKMTFSPLAWWPLYNSFPLCLGYVWARFWDYYGSNDDRSNNVWPWRKREGDPKDKQKDGEKYININIEK